MISESAPIVLLPLGGGFAMAMVRKQLCPLLLIVIARIFQISEETEAERDGADEEREFSV